MALVRRLLPDDLDEPRHLRLIARIVHLSGDGQPRALERQAELADLQCQLGTALLSAERPHAERPRRGARPPESHPDPAHHPDELLQGRGLEHLLLGPLRVDLRELSAAGLRPKWYGFPGLRARELQRCLWRRGCGEGHPLLRQQLAEQLELLLRQGSAEAGQRPGFQVLQHREVEPRAEVQLQLSPANRRFRHGAARATRTRATSTSTRLRTTASCSPVAFGRSSRTCSGAERSPTRSRRAT